MHRRSVFRCTLAAAIRDMDTARAAIDAGVSRIMLGTAAVEDADLIGTLLGEFGAESVIVSVDAKDGNGRPARLGLRAAVH